MRARFVLAALIVTVIVSTEAHADFTPVLVARTGNPLPGSGFNLSTSLLISGAGPNTFHISGTVRNSATGSIVFGSALWQNGALSLLSYDGMPAPGLPGVTMTAVITRQNNSWQSLSGTLLGPSAPGANALWLGAPGNLQRVLTNGDAAPQAPQRTIGSATLEALTSGRAAVITTLKDLGGQPQEAAVYDAQTSTLNLVTRIPLVHDEALQAATPAAANQVVVRSGSTLLTEQAGIVRTVVGNNVPVPGMNGGTFSALDNWSVNGQATLAFSAFYTPPNEALSRGVFVGTADGVRILAKSGEIMPGTNQVFPLGSSFGDAITMNSAGTIVMNSGETVFRSTATGWQPLLTRFVTPLPGGGTFTGADKLSIDESGNVYFYSSGPAIGDFSIWSVLSTGQIVKIVRNGDLLDFGNGTQQEVFSLSYFGGNSETGNLSSILPNGTAFHVKFVTGNAGVYVVQVPEPASMMLIITSSAGLVVRHRRRRGRRRARAGAPAVSARRA